LTDISDRLQTDVERKRSMYMSSKEFKRRSKGKNRNEGRKEGRRSDDGVVRNVCEDEETYRTLK